MELIITKKTIVFIKVEQKRLKTRIIANLFVLYQAFTKIYKYKIIYDIKIMTTYS